MQSFGSPLHSPLPRPDPRALAPLHLRLRAFGLAPTPDPDQSWHQLRPLLRDHRVTPLHRLSQPRIRGAIGAALALTVLLSSVSLAAPPMLRLVVGPWSLAWEGLVRLTGTGDQEASMVHAKENRGWTPEAEAVPAVVDGLEDDPRSRGGGSPNSVVAPHPPLVAKDDWAGLAEDSATTIYVLRNDEGLDQDIEVRAARPSNGTVSVNEDRTITYTPVDNFVGLDAFRYALSDEGRTSWADVTVQVSGVNDPPWAVDDKVGVDEDDSVSFDVIENDGDVDGDNLDIKPEPPAHGKLEVSKDGSLTYEPFADFNGEDTFSYRLDDGQAEPAVANVVIRVRPVNDDPVATDNQTTTPVGTPVLIDVLKDDSDPDSDPLEVTLASAVYGQVSINPDSSLLYTPAPQFTGLDTISYQISDGEGGTDLAEVAVRVTDPTTETQTGSGSGN